MDNSMHIQQIVESSYAWANGDLAADQYVGIEDLTSDPNDGFTMDGLLDFLVRETAADSNDENSAEHLAEALGRMEQVLREVTSVRDALAALCPGCGRNMVKGDLHTDDCTIDE